jgi:WD40 repeat protein
MQFSKGTIAVNFKSVLGAALLLSLGACSSFAAERAAGVSPPQRTLTIPLSGARPGEYSVACGTALPLSAVAFSPDGKTLAVGGYREVLLWDLAAGKLAKRIGTAQIGSMVQAVLFTKDGRSLVEAEGAPCAAGAVRVFELQSGQTALNLQEPKGAVFSLDLGPDGKLLAGGCGDAAAYVWSLPEKKLVAKLNGHALAVSSVSFAPDGKHLATASLDKTVQVWDVATWKPDRKKTTLEAPVRRCCLRDNGRPFWGAGGQVTFRFGLIVGGHDGRSVQNRMDDKAAPEYRRDVKAELDTGTPLDCLWLQDPDPGKWNIQWAYVAASDNTVKAYTFDGQKLDLVDTLGGHSDWVYALAISTDGKRLASASGDGSVKLWNRADRSLLGTFVQLSPGTDDWLIVTGQGYFATSNPSAVQGKTSGFHDAEKVRQALAEKKVPPK